MYAILLFACACAPRIEASKDGDADVDTDADADTDADTGVVAEVPNIHVEGTVAGEAYTFDCGAEVASRAYSTFPDGANWFASLSCDGDEGDEGDDWVDVVATDAEVGRVYRAEDAGSFNAFAVVLDDGAAASTTPTRSPMPSPSRRRATRRAWE